MVNALLLLLASATGLQDPTQPLTGAIIAAPTASSPGPVAAPNLHLQAIFTGGRASAIIDGKPYGVGDQVQNYRLLRINPSQVLLQGQNQVLTLTLFPSLSMSSN